jgi:hypothetical protein
MTAYRLGAHSLLFSLVSFSLLHSSTLGAAGQLPTLAPAEDRNMRVSLLVECFRDPGTRTSCIGSVGTFVKGYAYGVGTNRTQADPLARAATICFGTWSIGQAGEWLLQYWERTPETWDKNWMEAAIVRILERLQSSSQC